ncbi:MAG: CvpA family protein [Oscillospiraceae bacterium]|nr:CvpA family protein [Oscillospiraceae bacterium]
MSITPYLIYDLVIVLLLAAFLLHGAKKGLVYMLLGVLAVFVSTAGARVVANTLSPMVAEALEPKLATVIEEQLEEQLQGTGLTTGQKLPPDLPIQTVLDALKELGIYSGIADTVGKAVEQGMITTAASAAAAAAAAAAQSVASSLIFSISFFLIMILWKTFSRTMNLVARLPVVRTFNKTGGAALGLLIGCAVFFVVGWIVRFLGNIIPEDAIQQTYLLRFFLTENPIALLLGG